MQDESRSAAFPRSDEGLTEALSEAVCVVDDAGTLRYLNAAAEELIGGSRRRLLGQSLAQVLAVDAGWLERVADSIRNGVAFTVRELALSPLHAGTTHQVDVSVTPWQPPEGPVLAVLEMVPVDRHLRIAREESLRAQEQASRRVLRGLAHEIRNPLAGLRGATQLLDGELEDPALREYTGIVLREVDRLRDLVERMVGPVQAPRRAPMNVHEVTEDVAVLLRAEAGPGATVRTDYDPSIPELQADRDQLVQALLNLGRNALQAVGEQGSVWLRTCTLRQFTVRGTRHRLVAVIEVADDGPGISPELRDTLFQPMVSGRAEGSGLGLTIAQSLVGRHGGLIECESGDGGTVFRMLLPLEAGDE